jgi:hypothetical protein
MSQTLDAPQSTFEAARPLTTEAVPQSHFDPADRELQQFSYRPVPLLAIIGLTLSVLSVSAFLGVVGIALAVLGIITSLAATLKIAFDREAYGGLKLACTGLILSTLMFVGGLYNQIDLYRREVPKGFQRVNFAQDISAKEFVFSNGMFGLHPDVASLVGKPIFLKAWMFPTDDKRNLTQFLVVKDNGLCCFGKQPAPQDSINVILDPEAFPYGVDYCSGMVSLAGTFEIHPDPGPTLSTNNTIYVFRVSYFEKSWTMF